MLFSTQYNAICKCTEIELVGALELSPPSAASSPKYLTKSALGRWYSTHHVTGPSISGSVFGGIVDACMTAAGALGLRCER